MTGVLELKRRLAHTTRHSVRQALSDSDRAGIRALINVDDDAPETHQEVYNRAREDALADALNFGIIDD